VETPCATPPNVPYAPAKGRAGENVGNGTDLVSAVSGKISWAEGSFPSVTGVTSESDGSANNYSLQLNSNPFSGAPLCAGARTPSACQGWEQFLSTPGVAFIQYWLLNYVNTCPSGWNAFQGNCFKNSNSGVSVAAQPITTLGNQALTGAAGSSDTVTMWIGDGNLYAYSQASVLNLSGGGWTSAEFNVFGNANSTQAVFNSGASIVVQTVTDSVTQTTTAPTCESGGFTGETTNLNLVANSCCPVGGDYPGIQFTESDVSGATAQACPTYLTTPTMHGFMIKSDTNSALAVNAWGGAENGTALRLANNCTVSNPDCTWSYVNGMILSDRNPALAVNAYGGAKQGTVLKLVTGCNTSLTDCTWTYSHGEFLSDTNPALAVNAYGGAKEGTTLELVNGCSSGLTDCTFSLENMMLSSSGNTGFNVNAYGGARNDGPLEIVNGCTTGLTDCTFSFHLGMITSDTNSSLAMNAYGGAASLNPVELVSGCSTSISTCTWTWSHGEIITDSSPSGSPLVINTYGGIFQGAPLKIVSGCNTGLSTCVLDGIFGK
jgi:hypothetical protein